MTGGYRAGQFDLLCTFSTVDRASDGAGGSVLTYRLKFRAFARRVANQRESASGAEIGGADSQAGAFNIEIPRNSETGRIGLGWSVELAGTRYRVDAIVPIPRRRDLIELRILEGEAP
ncbi:MAG: hypothetical protein AAF415_02300 [Pseudomonadota bacterium]